MSPMYDHECLKCGLVSCHCYSIKEDKACRCPKCGGKTKRIISSGINVIIKGWSPDNELRREKKLAEIEKIRNEPMTRDEMERLPDVAREEEKKRGLEEGTILGGKNKKVRRQKSEIKDSLKKKAREQKDRIAKDLK